MEQCPIGGDEVSGSEFDNVPWNDFLNWDGHYSTIASNVGVDRNRTFKGLGSEFSPVLLDNIEGDRKADDQDDDYKARDIACRARNRRRNEEDSYQRFYKPLGSRCQDPPAGTLHDHVPPETCQTLLGFYLGEADCAARDLIKQRRVIEPPKRGL
jgi:hypothetical protein